MLAYRLIRFLLTQILPLSFSQTIWQAANLLGFMIDAAQTEQL